eukprot:s2851_g4.t1
MHIKELQRMKEEEIEGGWYTEEKMQKELSYSSKFKYDENVTEYFVETADTVKVKRHELDRWLSAEEKNPEE